MRFYEFESKQLFGKHGMVITGLEPVAQHGGSLRLRPLRIQGSHLPGIPVNLATYPVP